MDSLQGLRAGDVSACAVAAIANTLFFVLSRIALIYS